MPSSETNVRAFRHQITWQRRNLASPPSGSDDFVWSDVLTCRASIEQAGFRQSAEHSGAQQTIAEWSYEITQHYSRGLNTEMRIGWWIDGEMRYLDVLDIQDATGSGRFQLVHAERHT